MGKLSRINTYGRVMPDVPESRRKVMSAVRHKHTGPELLARSIIHRLGYRFTANGPKNRELAGSPDLVLPGRRTVIFVHGCFWHGHTKCQKYRPPKTRTDFWNNKIERNRTRDKRILKILKEQGWRVLIVWECELHPARRKNLEDRLKKQIPQLLKHK